MPSLFWDTSALAKLYVMEHGTTWVQTQIRLPIRHFIAEVTAVELYAAVALRARSGPQVLSPLQTSQAYQLIQIHLQNLYNFVHLTPLVISTAQSLILRYPLKALDAIQLASALVLAQGLQRLAQDLTFICADKALLKAATSEALPCDDPSLYPAV